MEQTMGKRIMRHRKALGLTQEQLAEKLGVTAQAVSKWENDQSCPDIYMLPKLAELFETTTDELLGHTQAFRAAPVETADEDEEKGGWEFHWDAGRRDAYGFAVFFLLVGALLFASRYFGWDASFWEIVWPSALLVGALFTLRFRFRFTNIVCAVLGAYFLVSNLGIFDLSFSKSLIFPALIVIFGISLLLDAMGKPKKGRFRIHKRGDISKKTKKHFVQEGERFECDMSFGEVRHLITLPRLSAGCANVSFGEMEIDLSGCGEIADGCEIEACASFGELRLKVPSCYGVSFGELSIEYV
ncbi:MAG: helix-turn-helix transcriptional regulator [Oscillospiraceae bacterium]|nr:helix-turn-helix transcriptional regulator [Oscillospiraceae bacterium]